MWETWALQTIGCIRELGWKRVKWDLNRLEMDWPLLSGIRLQNILRENDWNRPELNCDWLGLNWNWLGLNWILELEWNCLELDWFLLGIWQENKLLEIDRKWLKSAGIRLKLAGVDWNRLEFELILELDWIQFKSSEWMKQKFDLVKYCNSAE